MSEEASEVIASEETPKETLKAEESKMSTQNSEKKTTKKSSAASSSYGETATLYLTAVSEKLPPSLRPHVKKALPLVEKAADLLQLMIPKMVILYQHLMELYTRLLPYHPELLAPAFAGVIMCFFGGSYMTLIAAYEAYRQSGWETTKKCIDDLMKDFQKVIEANAKDDVLDEDGDGVADVKQISSVELATRKSLLFFRTVDPVRFSGALSGIQTGFMAVVATLKVQFVKAIALGNSIAEILDEPATRYVVPTLELILPEGYKRWAHPVVTYSVKSISVSIAWTLARVISAFHSALKGGVMATRNILDYLDTMGFYKINHEDTYIDEVAGYALSALGLWFQLSFAFQLPLLMNILLFPFTLAEWFLVACVNRM